MLELLRRLSPRYPS